MRRKRGERERENSNLENFKEKWSRIRTGVRR
jgi:hypothetical protein